MVVTFARLYNGGIYGDQVVPENVRAGAEQQTQHLLTTREHTLYTKDGREFRRGQAWGSECWRVTYTPEALIPEVLTEERPTPQLAAPGFTLTAPTSTRAGHQTNLFNGIE